MKTWLTYVLLFTSFLGYAQKEADHWYFGHLAGLDFSSGSPVPATDGNLVTEEGCATISTEMEICFSTPMAVLSDFINSCPTKGTVG
jgi:hypothetical protein